MRSLLPGSSPSKKTKRALREIVCLPGLPPIPGEKVWERMQLLEQINAELPVLVVFQQPGRYPIELFLVKEGGILNEDNFLNWAALSYLQVSTVPVKVVVPNGVEIALQRTFLRELQRVTNGNQPTTTPALRLPIEQLADELFPREVEDDWEDPPEEPEEEEEGAEP